VPLTQLKINNIRNLESVELQHLQQINVFYGNNGSGKTSLLESIHMLGMARSFRGKSVKSLISHGSDHCTVFGHVAGKSGNVVSGIPVGIHRAAAGEVLIKIAGKPVRTVSSLVEQLPLQVINADSFELLTGSPNARRRYLDWGVFHVEHQFFSQWQVFQRCIKQRNKLLRHDKISDEELAVWSRNLAESGSAINQFRKAYFTRLAPRFADLVTSLTPALEGLELRFRQGWDKSLSYEEALAASKGADVEQGYTHLGPQRADIRVMINGHLASETLSRGQQKLVVCALKLAQGQLLSELGRVHCTYLVDDLPSELDEVHGRLVCQQLAAMGSQVFITCVGPEDIRALWPAGGELTMFHVEHGTVEPAIHSDPARTQ
jgi:DNA replication and repair protein RecF